MFLTSEKRTTSEIRAVPKVSFIQKFHCVAKKLLMSLFAAYLTLDDLASVRNAASDAAVIWFDLGLNLGLKHLLLARIRGDFQNQAAECLREMLTEWLKNATPRATVEGLVRALELAKCHDVAEQVRKVFGIPVESSSGSGQL